MSSSTSRQRSIIRHPHDYTGAQVEARTEGSGPNRQSITVEYAYASNNRNTLRASQYASSRGTTPTPRAGSPVDRVRNEGGGSGRVRHSTLSKQPSAGTTSKPRRPERGDSITQQQYPPPVEVTSPTTYEDSYDHEQQQIYQQPQLQQQAPSPPSVMSPPARPSRANTESLLQDMYTPEVAAYSDDPSPMHPQQSYYDHTRRDSLPDLPPDAGVSNFGNNDDQRAFTMNNMADTLPPVDLYSPPPTAGGPGPSSSSGIRSRSATTSNKPKKSGMLSFMSGPFIHCIIVCTLLFSYSLLLRLPRAR